MYVSMFTTGQEKYLAATNSTSYLIQKDERSVMYIIGTLKL